MHLLIFKPLVLLAFGGATHFLAYKTGKKSGKKEAAETKESKTKKQS